MIFNFKKRIINKDTTELQYETHTNWPRRDDQMPKQSTRPNSTDPYRWNTKSKHGGDNLHNHSISRSRPQNPRSGRKEGRGEEGEGQEEEEEERTLGGASEFESRTLVCAAPADLRTLFLSADAPPDFFILRFPSSTHLVSAFSTVVAQCEQTERERSESLELDNQISFWIFLFLQLFFR